MIRKCIICGRQLKTGRKYCYQHRSMALKKKSKRKISNKEVFFLMVIGVVIFIIGSFSKGGLLLLIGFVVFFIYVLKPYLQNQYKDKSKCLKT